MGALHDGCGAGHSALETPFFNSKPFAHLIIAARRHALVCVVQQRDLIGRMIAQGMCVEIRFYNRVRVCEYGCVCASTESCANRTKDGFRADKIITVALTSSQISQLLQQLVFEGRYRDAQQVGGGDDVQNIDTRVTYRSVSDFPPHSTTTPQATQEALRSKHNRQLANSSLSPFHLRCWRTTCPCMASSRTRKLKSS